MHQLTITSTGPSVVTRHDDFGDAHSALLAHVRTTDTYMRSVTESRSDGHATFQLISVDDTGRAPRVTATASIAPAEPTS